MNTVMKASFQPEFVHTSIDLPIGRLAVRDALPVDAEGYINYWHYSGEEVKNLLGIDRKKLGTPKDSHDRFLKMIRHPDRDQKDIIFSITLNNELIGYTNINYFGLTDSFVHLHTYRSYIQSILKAQHLSRNLKMRLRLASVLIGLIGMYFDLLPVRRVLLQTRTTNTWINRALDLYMPAAETKYIDNPPGLGAPGECHIRYVHREDAHWMRRQSELLGRQCQKITQDYYSTGAVNVPPPPSWNGRTTSSHA